MYISIVFFFRKNNQIVFYIEGWLIIIFLFIIIITFSCGVLWRHPAFWDRDDYC